MVDSAMRDATIAGPTRPNASQRPGTEDAITARSDDDNGVGAQKRIRKPSVKVRENGMGQDALDAALLSSGKRNGSAARGAVTNDTQAKTSGKDCDNEDATMQTLQEQMNKQTGILRILLDAWTRQEAHNKEMQAELGRIKNELQAVKEECQAVKEECQALKDEMHRAQQQAEDRIAALVSGQGSPRPSYADVARTPPTSQPSNIRTLSSTLTSTLYCTIDTSRVEEAAENQVSAGTIRTMVESGIRAEKDDHLWRCKAVTKDPRNPHRVRIACRDETEHAMVKRVVGASLTTRGTRILRDDLHPIRVDSVNRAAVLDEAGVILTGAAEALGKENDTEVAKIAWLSNRDVPKAYGSMVVYLSKGSDAQRFLREGFFSAGGESGYTKMFERRERPKQCYNCQEVTDHKAYQCTKPRVCGRCAKEGHRHSECTETIAKCVPCGGPHESFSKNCRKLYPSRHE